jgi:hypothetical protein
MSHFKTPNTILHIFLISSTHGTCMIITNLFTEEYN